VGDLAGAVELVQEQAQAVGSQVVHVGSLHGRDAGACRAVPAAGGNVAAPRSPSDRFGHWPSGCLRERRWDQRTPRRRVAAPLRHCSPVITYQHDRATPLHHETKARYAFVYGDLRRLHRMGLIACQYRAAEWRHKEVELAAHDLLQYLDKRSG
jgi:hypothetical protein